jgi:hypothetical protein
MSREIRRVPLNFYWPLNKVWKGYTNPKSAGHWKVCTACDGSGYSPLARLLKDQWYGNAYFRPSFTGSSPFHWNHPFIQAFSSRQIQQSPEFYGTGQEAVDRNAKRLANLWNAGWSHHLDQDDVAVLLAEERLNDFVRAGIENPTPEQVNEWSLGGFGHDSINCYLCLKAKMQRLGERLTCESCHGKGDQWDSRDNRKRAERWKMKQPPTGPGYQVWETITEGSPISPVFRTPEALASWLVAKKGYTPEAAKGFAGAGWCPSMMSIYKDIEVFDQKAPVTAGGVA